MIQYLTVIYIPLNFIDLFINFLIIIKVKKKIVDLRLHNKFFFGCTIFQVTYYY